MPAQPVTTQPVRFGWSVRLQDGTELARFRGPTARWRAARFLLRLTEA